MGDNYAMDASGQRRPKAARLPLVGESEARQVEAELRTTQALESLDPDVWTIVKDLEWPGGRYGHVDHVAVGRSGVYVVDTKTWGRDVSVYGGKLRHEGHTEDSVITNVTEAAAAVALLTPGVPQQLVRPVVCVSGSEGLNAQVSGVLVCSTDQLAPMLESRVHSMSTHQITIASSQLRDHLHDRGLVKVAARAGHSEVKKAKRQPGPMRGVPVIRIAIAVWFVATLVLAPHVFTDTYNTIHDTVQEKIGKHTAE
jgi:Nuclease-related domain